MRSINPYPGLRLKNGSGTTLNVDMSNYHFIQDLRLPKALNIVLNLFIPLIVFNLKQNPYLILIILGGHWFIMYLIRFSLWGGQWFMMYLIRYNFFNVVVRILTLPWVSRKSFWVWNANMLGMKTNAILPLYLII